MFIVKLVKKRHENHMIIYLELEQNKTKNCFTLNIYIKLNLINFLGRI